MHLVGWLGQQCDDRMATEMAARHNVDVAALSHYALEPTVRPALLLGYSSVDKSEIYDGAKRLALALEGLAKSEN